MGESIRVRTELGINKSINIELNQEFEFLEILSLKLNQQDIYLRACSDYGVIVGRVTANNGFGLPNARVSIFIPIEAVDESNPIISSIYPYKSPEDKNEDGYRYNLLPYEKSYSTHAATGTLPTRLDVLTGNTAFEIYERYYKFTAKTNESGDYMIMGVPLGEQTVIMDVDLSDIGEFSLTPQDLVRIGRATETQVAGNRFRTSADLNSLPQIVNLSKSVEISPLWGEPSICQIAINRVDFDLRDEANIDIQPTSVFMGSVFTTDDQFRIRPDYEIAGIPIQGSKPKDNFGNLCSLQPGPGQILAIRQTINLDLSGNPILEEYKIEQNGNVIDENGAWLIELPMNLDYFITNEFGERVISYDPTIGIPTKAKYRFKVKWIQPQNITTSVRRPYFLIPNVKEYGWTDTVNDPNLTVVGNKQQLESSYYFGLDWSGYTNGFNGTQFTQRIEEVINCEDTFYEFQFNRVYTVSSFIDQFKNGGRARFVGIKEIDNNECVDSVNKFPVNEGYRNFDFLFFIVSLLLQVLQLIAAPLIVVIHFVAFFAKVLGGLKNVLLAVFGTAATIHLYKGGRALYCGISNSIKAKQKDKDAIKYAEQAVQFTAAAVNALLAVPPNLAGSNAFLEQSRQATKDSTLAFTQAADFRKLAADCFQDAKDEAKLFAKNLGAVIAIRQLFRDYNNQKPLAISLPVLTYPECQGCECGPTEVTGGERLTSSLSTLFSRFSDPYLYYAKLSQSQYVTQTFGPEDNVENASITLVQALGGSAEDPFNTRFYKTMESTIGFLNKDNGNFAVEFYAYSNDLPLGERVNLFNTRKKYFDGLNRIKVTFDLTGNTNFHYDNTLSVFLDVPLPSGTLLTFVDPEQTRDVNYLYSGMTGGNPGLRGTATNPGPSIYTVNYCSTTDSYSDVPVNYNLGYGSDITGYTYPADIEYYQVVTAITVSQAASLFAPNYPVESLPSIVNSSQTIFWNNRSVITIPVIGIQLQGGWGGIQGTFQTRFRDTFDRFDNQYITILQRGVDPYSPAYKNRYSIGKLFGYPNEDDIKLDVSLKLNVPIQKLDRADNMQVQPFTPNGQSKIFYPSHFFRGGIAGSTTTGEEWSAFTTFNVGYYSALDATNNPPGTNTTSLGSNYDDAVVSNTGNGAYSNFANPGKYNSGEDISGSAFFFVNDGDRPSNTSVEYYTKVLLPDFTGTPMNITSNVLNVLRTDRLPSSDTLDGGSWDLNPSLLQQNLGFAIYEITALGNGEIGISKYGTGADIVEDNLEGQFAEINVLSTLNNCSNIVALECYEGTGTGFTVNPNCVQTDAVITGCYRFVRKPLIDIRKDIRNFNEWAYRYRFFYGLCRGVLSQTFTNNWINGTLFAFPIQVDITFNSRNKANPPNFPKKLIYYNNSSNNFYFRSSPYTISNNTFIGRPTSSDNFPTNARNLLFPTTIMNLGMKDSFYGEIIMEPSTRAYVMNALNSTSYSDTSDIINLFIISRITNASFFQKMLGARDYSINSLFTRNNAARAVLQPKNRVDADLVQMMSINTEVGNVPFSTEFYPFSTNNPNNAVVSIAQTNETSTIGIFFSSSTEDLQIKDFLTPGIINFRFNPNISAVTYKFGIKSQEVPFYQWELSTGTTVPSIFGSETNNWATNLTDIVKSDYQDLSRRSISSPSYFVPKITSFDVNQRGYIFNIDNNGIYDFNVFSGMKTKFMVGAPYQFYFGVVKGASAMDKFKQKYLPNE